MLSKILLLLLYLKCVQGLWPSSYKNEQCISECILYENKYYYCWTESSWGYCSPLNGLDSNGDECSSGCGFYGESYMWCYLKKGGWNYCSKGDINNSPKYLSSKIVSDSNYYCKDNCEKRGETYYWCNTFNHKWGKCSPSEGITELGRSCKYDHKCGYYGESYRWCYTTTGRWDYCHPQISQPTWSNFKVDTCLPNIGKATYIAELSNTLPKFSFLITCANYPISVAGQKSITSRDCYYDYSIGKLVGRFDLIFDKYISPIGKKCYFFEPFQKDRCDDEIINTLNRRGKRAKQCDEFERPANFWNLIYIATLIARLVRQNGQRQNVMPEDTYPLPRYVSSSSYGLIPNSFTFNGRFSFRLLRSNAQERYNRIHYANNSSNYIPRPSEGNGLDGLSPLDSSARYTIYEHISQGRLWTQYISTTTDFGRTMRFAIQQALSAFTEEARINHGVGYNRYFVQIDMNGLQYTDLTGVIDNNYSFLPPSQVADLEVVNFARRWSEILVRGRIPRTNIVRTFRVYAVSSQDYVIEVIDNIYYIDDVIGPVRLLREKISKVSLNTTIEEALRKTQNQNRIL